MYWASPQGKQTIQDSSVSWNTKCENEQERENEIERKRDLFLCFVCRQLLCLGWFVYLVCMQLMCVVWVFFILYCLFGSFMVVCHACCHELLMAFRIRVLQGDTRWEDLPHSQVGQICTHCHCPSPGKSSPCANAWEMSTWSVNMSSCDYVWPSWGWSENRLQLVRG